MDPSVRREYPGVADQHVEATKALNRTSDHRLDFGEIAHVRQERLYGSLGPPKPGDGRLQRRGTHITQHEVSGGFAGELFRDRRSERAPAPVMATTLRVEVIPASIRHQW